MQPSPYQMPAIDTKTIILGTIGVTGLVATGYTVYKINEYENRIKKQERKQCVLTKQLKEATKTITSLQNDINHKTNIIETIEAQLRNTGSSLKSIRTEQAWLFQKINYLFLQSNTNFRTLDTNFQNTNNDIRLLSIGVAHLIAMANAMHPGGFLLPMPPQHFDDN
jgi:uncharacterized protein YoxC